MRKFRKLTIGGIENKIFNLILVAMILVAGMVAAVIATQNRMLSQLTEETTERQQSSITETTTGVLDSVIRDSMGRATEMEAQVTDEMFRDAGVRVRMVGDYARKLLDDPDNAPRMPWIRPEASRNGELFVKALLAEGVEEESVSDRLGVIANMSDMMISLCSSTGTDNIWFSLPEGATLMADTVPGNWIQADGSYVSYNAEERYWYRQAEEEKRLIFSDVEIDKRTGEMCVTCALPVYGADGKLLGVAGTDLFLTEMQRKVAESTANGGSLMVINHKGHVIISPEEQDVFRALESEKASDLRESDNAELAALIRDAMQGSTGVRKVPLKDGIYYMIGVPMETVGWTLIASFNEKLAEEPVRTLRGDYERIQEEAAAVYRHKNTQGTTLIWVILGGILAVMLTGAIFAGKRIVKPLNTITEKIAGLQEDNLEFTMEERYRTGDEVEMLAQSFADLSHKTVEYIRQVENVTAEKERISTELHLARQIQEGMLPDIFPAYPERPEFDLYASMDPAKEVGGDFYDFFLADEDHLVLEIADVSGKGVPGALFMMVAKAILKNNAMIGRSPAEILAAANETICSNNKMQMFVTVWLGILEISTGRIVAANAGHEYPAIRRNGKGFELFRDRHGFVVGGMEGVRYKEYELQLRPGDKLFVYTDGVPEATNAGQELFGTERMISALNTCAKDCPQGILKSVRQSVDAFVDHAEQFDDLTMLCLEYKGKPLETEDTGM